ncbi:hypothetical protein AU476_27085 [Cupriavidus sp. UYMSc13B]|nr:hypothetical protein AU476_27085 [Cupriavidus sp. UYMSc13B]
MAQAEVRARLEAQAEGLKERLALPTPRRAATNLATVQVLARQLLAELHLPRASGGGDRWWASAQVRQPGVGGAG